MLKCWFPQEPGSPDWILLAEWPVKRSLLQGRWQLWLNRNCSAQGKGCLEPVNAFFFLFRCCLANFAAKACALCGRGAVVPGGCAGWCCSPLLLAAMALGFLLPALWSRANSSFKRVVSSIKNSVLSCGILLVTTLNWQEFPWLPRGPSHKEDDQAIKQATLLFYPVVMCFKTQKLLGDA